MTTRLGKYVVGVYLRKPFQKVGKSWQFTLSLKVSKSCNMVNKGKAIIDAYVVALPFVNIIVQVIKKRIYLVKDI